MKNRGSTKKYGTVSREREIAIVRAAFEGGGMTREQLMSTLRLNAFSTYTLTADLIGRGVLRELPADGNGENARRKLIAPNPGWGVIAGVDFDHEAVGIGIADFSGEIIAERVIGFDRMRLSTAGIVALAERHVRTLLRTVSSPRLLGIGIGLMGRELKDILSPASRREDVGRWTHQYTADRLRRAFGVPVVPDFANSCLALGEYWTLRGRGVRTLIAVSIGTGVGMGIIIDGTAIRGGTGQGNALGHVIVEEGGRQCVCGNRGCLGTYVVIPAILRRIGELRDGGVPTALGKDPVTLARAAAAFAAGDKVVRVTLEEAMSLLAREIANLIVIFRPERVVISGAIRRFGPRLEEMLQRKVQEYRWALDRDAPTEVVYSSIDNAVVQGAAVATLRRVISDGAFHK